VTYVNGTRSKAYPVISELEISELREVGKEVKNMAVFERVREAQ